MEKLNHLRFELLSLSYAHIGNVAEDEKLMKLMFIL